MESADQLPTSLPDALPVVGKDLPDGLGVVTPTWEPDVLPGFEQLTLPLEPDDEGEVFATLVRRARPEANNAMDAGGMDAGVDVLYVHGWTDYFHQVHVADFFAKLGFTFYALDLRKYGRSLRSWQTPGYITSLKTYAADLKAALTAMGHGPDTPLPRKRSLVMMGHSTGGLIACLYAVGHPGVVDALILNSPWLEFQTGAIGRRALEGPVRAQARIAPTSGIINPDPGYYLRSVSAKYEGDWPLIEEWRPEDGWKPTAAWLNAIFRGQARVAQGLDLKIPILVLLSARSTVPTRWKPELKSSDTVLVVSEVAQRAPTLGQVVTTVRLEGALHDVTLSAAPVRNIMWAEMERWINAYVPLPGSDGVVPLPLEPYAPPAPFDADPEPDADQEQSADVATSLAESLADQEHPNPHFWEAFGTLSRRFDPKKPWVR